jgi:hypothetical protein
MNNKHLGKFILIITVLVLALGFGLTRSTHDPVAEIAKEIPPRTETVILSVTGLYEAKVITVVSGETILDMLKTLNSTEPNLQLVTKDYPGLGTLVESMNGLTNGTNDNYWQYQVNGTRPQISADQFILSNGDDVKWTFAPSEF